MEKAWVDGIRVSVNIVRLNPHPLSTTQNTQQNLPSLVVSHVLAPRPGSSVVDLCACPGGKSTHLAALVGAGGAGGLVVACDRTYVCVTY